MPDEPIKHSMRHVNNMAQSQTWHSKPVATVEGSTSLAVNPAQHGEQIARNVENETNIHNSASRTKGVPHMLWQA